MFILQHSKVTFYALVSRHIMKRYLGLESKRLGRCLGHLALALIAFGIGFGICGLIASALWRIPLWAMASATF